ncbi:MAG: PIG-L family deacetylase [Pyrinomonadaceae bacterium]|nr:PIG-L family deacetylase [Pyrinomonadaceae bacterium]
MKRLLPHPLLLLVLIALLLLPSTLRAQPPAVKNTAETQLALKKLTIMGSVLYIAAHPDDENTALLSYLASERAVRTAYLSLTRGDGGQNLIGTEQGELLGLVRTQELLAARRVDGAEQFFTRAIDFGYTKSPEETLRIWGHDEVLADVVWVIRRFRPDVIITRFPTTGEGGHGQHTASAILAREAFDAAGDPARFPEQLRQVQAWKPQRLMWNVFSRQGERPSNLPNLMSVDVGSYNSLLGKSYTEIAAASRSMHKSQGFGSAERRGSAPQYFANLAGDAPVKDILDGVDLSWNRVPGGATVRRILEDAARQFTPSAPQVVLPLLLRAHREMSKLPSDHPLVNVKRQEMLDLIRACSGLWIEAIAAEAFVVPGGEMRVTTTLVNRSDFPLRLESVGLPFGNAPRAVNVELKSNQPLSTEVSVRVPETAEFSHPYWLRQNPGKGIFSVSDPRLIGTPENAASLPMTFNVAVGDGGEKVVFELPALFRWTDRVRGEQYRAVEIAPPVVINVEEKALVFPDHQPKQMRLTLRSNVARNTSGTLRLRLPEGWRAAPESIPVALKDKGEELSAMFTITPSHAPSTGTLAAEFEGGGKRFAPGMMEIDYSHIPRQTLFPPAQAKLVRLDVQRRGAQIGYVMGSGDEVPEALRQIGYQVTLLSDNDLDGADLKRFDAIITGVRAYNTRLRLRAQQVRLLEYVEAGGTLVLQYNTLDRSLDGVRLGPYPFKLSQERVTVEEAPVKMLAPQDALMNEPNKITAADFDGWVQERGLYFPNEWDQKYQPLFESHDPGEGEKRGGTLIARYGRGTYIYTSYSWFRQLPAGVPGAYRIFVNMISAGKK